MGDGELRSAAQKMLPRIESSQKLISAGSKKITTSEMLTIPSEQGKVSFEVACAGNGSFDIMRTTRKPHSGDIPTVECDGKSQGFIFQGGDLEELTLQAYGETSGIAAWRFTKER
ncbi:hypothetical protein [Streptomyces sp. NBC_00859]|uniref:hypothetical protein n=1 Tax=Streptomyces sp. NBC_00859 TaxID=2903682 RepID=UPI00386762A3|nr:hypothetical protein OG584_22235 [Streptomyces sp. NBC_00859]